MKTQILRRCRFQIALSTLLGLLTLIAISCGTKANWLHQRHQFVARQRALTQQSNVRGLVVDPSIKKPVNAPAGLWILGERGLARVEVLVVVDEYSQMPINDSAQAKEAERLFPEAEIGGMFLSKADCVALRSAYP
jgi:hypothetical protein